MEAMKEEREPQIRLFTGLALSSPVRKHVAGVVDALAGSVSGVRWVAPDNIHVTLKFLGWCDPSLVDGIVYMMEQATEFLPLRLDVGGVGAFPSVGSARVIWVGAHDPEGKIEKIYRTLDKAAVKYGFKREKRKYVPHITVGRARKKPISLTGELIRRFVDRSVLDVSDIVLFSSMLKSTGAEYTVVERVGG